MAQTKLCWPRCSGKGVDRVQRRPWYSLFVGCCGSTLRSNQDSATIRARWPFSHTRAGIAPLSDILLRFTLRNITIWLEFVVPAHFSSPNWHVHIRYVLIWHSGALYTISEQLNSRSAISMAPSRLGYPSTWAPFPANGRCQMISISLFWLEHHCWLLFSTAG